MPDRLFRLYQRKRVVNINVNVTAAALLSTALVMALVWAIRDKLGWDWPAWGFTGFALVADIVLDVALFVAFHWVANHWRPLRGKTERERRELGARPPSQVRDTAKIQAERIVISPLYYVVASGLTLLSQRAGMHPSWAIGTGYVVALVLTRVLHTAWGLRSGTYVDHHRRDAHTRLQIRRRAQKQVAGSGSGSNEKSEPRDTQASA